MLVVILFLSLSLLYISIGVIVFSDLRENLLPGDKINFIYYILISVFWPLTMILYVFIVLISIISIIFITFFKKYKELKKK